MKKENFLRQCIKNREILEYSYKDVSDALENVTEEEYKNFENGKVMISKENLQRLVRLLCLEDFNQFDLEQYIDTSGLSDEEIDDLKEVVEKLVGELDA